MQIGEITMTVSLRRAAATLTAAAVLGAGLASGSSEAFAGSGGVVPMGIYDSTCVGQASDYPVRLYFPPNVTPIILRCGVTSSWGYRYIDGVQYFDGFTSTLDNKIENAFANGTPNSQGGNIVWWVNSGFVVVVDGTMLPDGAPVGITKILQFSP